MAILENTFYQYIDEDGILHESFFLPLSVLFIFLGLLSVVIIIIKTLIKFFRRKG